MLGYISNKPRIFNFDPRVKITLMLLISFVAMTGNSLGLHKYPRLFLMLIPVCLLIGVGYYYKGLILGIMIGMSWYIEAFMSIRTQLLLFIVVIIITKFASALAMGYFIVQTTQVETLIQGLERLKVSRKVTLPLAVMFRFIPTIKEESSAVKDAMTMRQIDVKSAGKHPIKYIEYRYVPLINSVLKIGNELTMSAITRGLNLTNARTSIHHIQMTLLDWMMLLGTLSLVILYYVT